MKVLRRRSKVFRTFFEFRDGGGEYRRQVVGPDQEQQDQDQDVPSEQGCEEEEAVRSKFQSLRRPESPVDINDCDCDDGGASSAWSGSSMVAEERDGEEAGDVQDEQEYDRGGKEGGTAFSLRRGGALMSYMKEVEIAPLVILLAMVVFGILTHHFKSCDAGSS